MSKPEIITEFTSAEDGITVEVFIHSSGKFGVTIYDIDAEEYTGLIKLFPTEAAALAVAAELFRKSTL